MSVTRIIAGSYEEHVVCYDLDETLDGIFHLNLSFTDHPHSGSIRCIAASKGGLVASGSTDETIHIYNANAGRDVGTLMAHTGAVTALAFIGTKFLVTASEDATLIVWKARTWEPLKTLRGHKGPVQDLALHPTGKLAMSTGNDKSLRTWNLIKGRSAYITNVKKSGSLVQFSPSGTRYALVMDDVQLQVFEMASAAVVFTHDGDKRINSVVFLSDRLLVFGGEGKRLSLVDVVAGHVLGAFDAHNTRIKDICSLVTEPSAAPDVTEGNDASDSSPRRWRVATASSDGWIKAWSLGVDEHGVFEHRLLAESNAGIRISCLCSYLKRSKSSGSSGKDGGDEEEKIKTIKLGITSNDEGEVAVKKRKLT